MPSLIKETVRAKQTLGKAVAVKLAKSLSSMAGCGKPSLSASTIVANSASGHHILRIDGYSRILTTATGEHLESLPFTVGCHRWVIYYYPNGDRAEAKNYISLYLYLLSSVDKRKPVKAEFQFSFVGNLTEQPLTQGEVSSFHNDAPGWGYEKFIKRKDFEASEHLRDDSFAIRCDVILINQTPAVAAMISVPPSDLQQHLGSLLQTKKGADVVFDVAGTTFAAHRCVLAARSPVFSAELFGEMKESNTSCVVQIEDIEPRVFKALLYLVYTDLFPNTNTMVMKEAEEGDVDDEDETVFSEHLVTNEAEEGDIDDDDETVFSQHLLMKEGIDDDDEDVLSQHLLVAADKYNLERLKLLCESKLCVYINVGTVATILALAEQHHCHELKNACFLFLSSSANLRAAMANDDFKHLRGSCPSIMEELVAMFGNLVP